MAIASLAGQWRPQFFKFGARVCMAAALLGSASLALAESLSPVGVWKTIDDKTGKPKALVTILEKNGEYIGRITKGLSENDDPNRTCTACTDERKGQKMLGLEIIQGIRQEGGEYAGGKILDPESGTVYRCKMKLVDAGKKLEVRGFVGISLLGRTQTWVREE